MVYGQGVAVYDNLFGDEPDDLLALGHAKSLRRVLQLGKKTFDGSVHSVQAAVFQGLQF